MEVRAGQGLNRKWGIAESPTYVYVDTGADWNLKSRLQETSLLKPTSEGPSKHTSPEPFSRTAIHEAMHLNAKSLLGSDFKELPVINVPSPTVVKC